MALALVVVTALAMLQGQPAVSQQTVPITILKRNDKTCSHNEGTETARNAISSYVQSHLDSMLISTLPINQSCGGSVGWTRIAYLNMTDPAQRCP